MLWGWRTGFFGLAFMWGMWSLGVACSTTPAEENTTKELIASQEPLVREQNQEATEPTGRTESSSAESGTDVSWSEEKTTEPNSATESSTISDVADSSIRPEPAFESASDMASEFGPEKVAQDGTRTDAGSGESSAVHERSPKPCTFNTDCPSGERCECDEQTGCFCQIGPRGQGKSGVDPCKTGNDCESSLCNEGNGGVFYCSGPCNQDSDCGPQLPICANISFLGKVCIRKKP